MGKREMSRNGFADCEREYNRREEAVEMAREERRETMSDTPRTDEVWGSMHGSGYQMMLLAQKLERELATYREWAEVEIADLRDDVKRHIEIASFNADDSLKWRTMFQNERDHMQAATEEIERLRGVEK